VCFFAHSEAELRRPEDDPVVAQRQVQAELAAEVQALQQQHLTQALSALLEANCQTQQTDGVAGIAGGQMNLLTLELLKQANSASNTPALSNGDMAAPNGNVQVALLQQLALLQQIQQQQQQQQQQQKAQVAQQDQQVKQAQEAQQLLSGLNQAGLPPQSSDPKKLQAVLAASNQSDFEQTLKNQLAEQLKTGTPTIEAINLLTTGATTPSGLHGDCQVPSVASSSAIGMSMPLSAVHLPDPTVTAESGSAAMPVNATRELSTDQGSPVQVGLLQNGAEMMQSFSPGQLAMLRARAAVPVSASRELSTDQSSPVQIGLLQDNAEMMQSLSPGQLAMLRARAAVPASASRELPTDQGSPVQIGLLQDNAELMQSLAPGQLAVLRARAAMAGQRRSIDNGVLARSASDLAATINATGIGRPSAEVVALTGDGGNAQLAGAGYCTVDCPDGQVQSTPQDAGNIWLGVSSEEALKQAKILLENLTLLQGGKNGSSVEGLLQGANMEALLNAGGLSALNRVTSVDK